MNDIISRVPSKNHCAAPLFRVKNSIGGVKSSRMLKYFGWLKTIALYAQEAKQVD